MPCYAVTGSALKALTERDLEAMGIQCIRVEREDELAQAVDASLSAAFAAERGVALILTQKFLGAKAF